MEKLRIFEAFAGYGSQSMALERLGIDFDVVGISEIDKYAIQAYMAVHGETKNYGDISKIDWNEVPDFNLFTYSFPCQDISNAGIQKGFEEGSGTRSSLLWECKKAIEAKKPKYLLMENVKALTSKKFMPFFKKWQGYLSSMGYSNNWEILNSKNFGVPQNRERCFMVSILGDESFFFPEGFPLVTRLKDVLESNVDEKYYLSKRVIDTFYKRNEMNEKKGNGFRFTPTHGEGIAHSILTTAGSRPDDNYVYGNKRVQSLVESGKIDGDHVQFLDAYNQAVSDDVAGTIRTTIDSSCMHFVTEPKLKRIGNIYGDKCGSNFAGNVYDKEGISPTLTSMTGGNREPMIIESLSECEDQKGTIGGQDEDPQIEQIGNIRPDTETHRNPSSGRVYSVEGIAPTILSRDFKEPKLIEDPKLIEPNVLTPKRTEYGKAVRKEYESGQLEESRHNMTEMRPRTDGVSNTITTVQKDNLLAEPQVGISVHPIGRKMEFKGEQSIKTDASPCLRATDYKNPHCVWEMEKGECLRIPQATAKGYIEVEPGGVFDGPFPESKTRRGRVQDGGRIYPTITSQGEPLNVYEGVEYKGKIIKEGDGLYTSTSDDFFRGGLDGISRTIKASVPDAGVVENYRIRKLTPRECFRLMGVLDSDIDKIEAAGISKTQQYRMAGNSIVVDVLCHIFRKMFIEKECESVQLSLF